MGPHLGSLVFHHIPIVPHGDIGSAFGTAFGILGVPPYPTVSPWRHSINFGFLWDHIWAPQMSPNLPLCPGIPFGTPFRVGDGDPPFLPPSPHGDVGSTFGFLWDHIWDPWCLPCPSCSPWRYRVSFWGPMGPHLGSLVFHHVPVAPHSDVGSAFGVLWSSSVSQCLPIEM